MAVHRLTAVKAAYSKRRQDPEHPRLQCTRDYSVPARNRCLRHCGPSLLVSIAESLGLVCYLLLAEMSRPLQSPLRTEIFVFNEKCVLTFDTVGSAGVQSK